MDLNQLKTKKIAILGFGIEGQAIADYLQANDVGFKILDKKNDANYLSSLSSFDLVFRSPGIQLSLPEIIAAKAEGTVFTSQIKYFFEHCPAKIIGITGTKGKGTTARLVYEILAAAGLPAYIGGNIGNGVLSLLPKLSSNDWVVLELSSFQLQDLEQSPHLAVVLMVTSEHLDYHESNEEYVQAKTSITRYQHAKDSAVINIDFPNSKEIGELGSAKKFFIHTSEQPVEIDRGYVASKAENLIYRITNGQRELVCTTDKFTLPGYHNLQNICAALQVADIVGVDRATSLDVAQKFSGLEHRLEFVAEVNGIKFYNDSFGTTPDATIAAAQAFTDPEILIVGGFDKKADYALLASQLANQKNIKAIIAIGVIAPVLVENLHNGGFGGAITENAKSMAEIFSAIRKVAVSGDVVVLAPGTSSFDMFTDYKDRGNQFKQEVFKF